MKRNIPPITEELLEYLEATFPDKLPSNPQTEVAVARLIGRQDVIRKLRDDYEKFSL